MKIVWRALKVFAWLCSVVGSIIAWFLSGMWVADYFGAGAGFVYVVGSLLAVIAIIIAIEVETQDE